MKKKTKKKNEDNFNVPIFVKWAGGKRQLLKQFSKLSLFPKKFNGYIEPFLGGGAVFFYIKKKKPKLKKIILSDINKELITTFQVVRDDVETLIKILKKHKKKHSKDSKDYYYKIRKKNPKKLSKLNLAARFIYLNKTCFNGLYRVNSKGKFNVPIGRYRNPNILDENALRKASKMLQNIKILKSSYINVIKHAKSEDFIYLDPPYLPISKTSNFTEYAKGAFSKKDQEKLAKIFKKLDEIGCFVMLSNSDRPFIRKLYSEYKKKTVNARRVISCNVKTRGAITELVIRNYK